MDVRADAETDIFKTLDSRFMMRCFYAFAALALLSIAISAAGKMLGRSIAMAGHTDATSLHEIVIGNNVLAVPANAIRFERARHDGAAARLDLYLRWPQMTGYTNDARDDFNHAADARNILFLSLSETMMSRDMSGRFEPIYRSLVVHPAKPLEDGLSEYSFIEKSGYLNEILVTADRGGEAPFVARCLSGPAAADSLAPCERDLHIGDNLSVSYRFPRELLAQWRNLDAAVLAKISRYLKTAR